MPNLPFRDRRAITRLVAALLLSACASNGSPAPPEPHDLPEPFEVSPRRPH